MLPLPATENLKTMASPSEGGRDWLAYPPFVYIIGSLRNPEVPNIANLIRERTGFRVFDDWYAAGPNADDHWRDYEKARGHTYLQALQGLSAKNVFSFDSRHLAVADAAVLVLPAGKSGHLELGWMAGRGKRTYILLDSPDRWDVMYQFASFVTDETARLVQQLQTDFAHANIPRQLTQYRDECPGQYPVLP